MSHTVLMPEQSPFPKSYIAGTFGSLEISSNMSSTDQFPSSWVNSQRAAILYDCLQCVRYICIYSICIFIGKVQRSLSWCFSRLPRSANPFSALVCYGPHAFAAMMHSCSPGELYSCRHSDSVSTMYGRSSA